MLAIAVLVGPYANPMYLFPRALAPQPAQADTGRGDIGTTGATTTTLGRGEGTTPDSTGNGRPKVKKK